MFDKSLYPEMIAQAIQLNDAKTLKTITESAIKSEATDTYTSFEEYINAKGWGKWATYMHAQAGINTLGSLRAWVSELPIKPATSLTSEERADALEGQVIDYLHANGFEEDEDGTWYEIDEVLNLPVKRSEATDTYRIFVKTDKGWEIADATADKDVAVALYNTLNRQFKSGNTKFSEIRLIQPGQADITEAKSITEAKDPKGLLKDLQDALDSIYDCKVENDVLTCADSDGNYIVVGITDNQPIELYLQVHSKQDVSETVNYLFDGIEPAADFIVAVFTAELAVIIQSREEGDNEIVPKEEIEIKEESKSEDGGTVASLGTPPILPAGQVSTIIQEDEDEKKKNESNSFDYINKQLDLLKDSSKVKTGVDMAMDPPNAPEVDKTPIGFIPVQPVEPLQAQDLLTSIATLALGAIEVDDDQAVAMIIESYKDLDSTKLKDYVSEAKTNNIEPLIGYIYETVNKNESSIIDKFKDMANKIVADFKANGYPKSNKYLLDFVDEACKAFSEENKEYLIRTTTDNSEVIITLCDVNAEEGDGAIYQARINPYSHRVKFSDLEGSNYAFESTSQKSEDTFKDPQLNNSRDVATNTTASGNDKPTPALADDIDPAPTEVEDFPKLDEPADKQSDKIAKSTDTADIT